MNNTNKKPTYPGLSRYLRTRFAKRIAKVNLKKITNELKHSVNDKLLDYYIKENLIKYNTIISQTNGDRIYPFLDDGDEHRELDIATHKPKTTATNTSDILATNNVILSPDNSDNEGGETENNNLNVANELSNEPVPDSILLHQTERLHIFNSLKLLTRAEVSDLLGVLQSSLQSDFSQVFPQNVLTEIFCNLPLQDLKECMRVNKTYRRLIENDDNLWSYVLKRENIFKNTPIDPNVSSQSNYRKFKYLENKFLSWKRNETAPYTRIVDAHEVDVITCLELTPKHVITAADDTLINIYDHKGEFLTTLKGHEGGVWALKYNVKTNQLITAGTDRTIRIWDLDTFLCTHIFMGHTSTVRCLDLTDLDDYGRVIISGSRDSNVLLWKLPPKMDYQDTHIYPLLENNDHYIGTLKGHSDSVRSMSVHENILVTGSYDGSCRVWNLKTMTCITVLKGHGNRVYAVCYDSVRKKVFSTSTDFRIFVWDLKLDSRYSYKDFDNDRLLTYSRPSMILNGHAGLVGLLELKGDILCSAAADGSVKGWDANDYKVLFQYYHDGTVPSSSFWFDENFLILGSESQFTICDLRTGKQLYSDLLNSADNIWGIRTNGDQVYAAIVQDHCSKLAILDFTEKVPREEYGAHDSDVNGGLCVEPEYMMERRGKTFLRLLEEHERDTRPNIVASVLQSGLGDGL